jgi:hypothetical protein
MRDLQVTNIPKDKDPHQVQAVNSFIGTGLNMFQHELKAVVCVIVPIQLVTTLTLSPTAVGICGPRLSIQTYHGAMFSYSWEEWHKYHL